MKLNLKNVQSLFRKGVFLRPDEPSKFPAAVGVITLYVLDDTLDHQYRSVGTVTRDMWLDLQPRELKRVITNMRNRATNVNPDRSAWQLETQCTGDYYSRELRVD